MNIYFYDNYSSSYNRFGNRVSVKVVEKNKYSRIFYIHDNYDNGKIRLPKKLRKHVTIIASKNIDRYVKAFPPSSFLCFSFRIPDVYWTAYFNKQNVATFQVMHGIYVKKYKRKLFYVLRDLPRILSYMNYLVKLLVVSKNKYNILINMIKKDIGFVAKSNSIDQETLSKTLILWGSHWKNWFIDNYGYTNQTRFAICGSFDFELLNRKDQIIDCENGSITYICHTFFEDGRVGKKQFNLFLNNLYDFAKINNKKLYIKLHPRSNVKLYEEFKSIENVVFTRKLPICDIYISHYSALLTVPAYLKKTIIMVQFSGHPIPEEYSNMATKIIENTDNISIDDLYTNNITYDYESYFKYESDPFGIIANEIS